jgi:Uma2 family endonuclease
MCRVVIQQAENLTVPNWVNDLVSFSRWVDSDEFPQEGRIDYLAGEIWIDMSQEQVWSHNQVKEEFFLVLGLLAKQGRQGRFFPDGLRLMHPEADLSAVPDGVFILHETFQTMRVALAQGGEGQAVRVEGSPDMVLEVVSTGSVRKDTERLRHLYWQAGVREYWLVDARQEPLRFDILRHTAKGYAAVRKQAGWAKSAVLGKSFRLTRGSDDLGHPQFNLEVKEGRGP